MIQLFRDAKVTQTNTTNLDLAKIAGNEIRNPKIKVRNNVYNITSGFKSQLSIWTYVCFQAMSKLVSNNLHIRQASVSGKDDELTRSLGYVKENAEETEYCISFIEIAPSNLKRASVRNMRTSMGNTEDALEKTMAAMATLNTPAKIIGITTDESKKHIYFFLTAKSQFQIIEQMWLVALSFRLLKKDVTADANTMDFLNNICKYLGTHADINDRLENEFGNLHTIFMNYIGTQIEYKIDRESELLKLITSITNKKYSTIESALRTAEERMNSFLTQLARERTNYDNLLFQYNSICLNKENDIMFNNIKEMAELLERSPSVLDYGIENGSIWINVRKPIKVNVPEEWRRITVKLFKDWEEKAIDLIIEALCNDSIDLYTSCYIRIDPSNMSISRSLKDNGQGDAQSIANPHISRYSCFGQHTTLIADALREGDYIGAIEQVLEAAGGLNWSDGPVTTNLGNTLYSNKSKPCFYHNDTKTWFSINDYMEGRVNFETITERNVEASADNN